MTSSTVHVDLADRSYDVAIGPGLLRSLGTHASELVGGGQAFLIFDANLPESTIETAVNSLEDKGFSVDAASIVALESNKTLETVERLLVEVGRARLERQDVVVALGGGITGDVGGFVGASWRRGTPVIQCPTTLLAMVDASVGGKTGVNLSIDGGLKKNMVGAFWQPRMVIADTSTLASLPARETRAGLGECVKHGLLCGDQDADLFNWTIEHLDAVTSHDANTPVATLVERNVQVKARIVKDDEREESTSGGGRALLNLGHTFGHAIEPLPHLTPTGDGADAPLLHGEAVVYGIIAATAAARAGGFIDDAEHDRIRAGLDRFGLRPLDLPPTAEVLDAMGHDKKVSGGRLRVVLPVGGGNCRVIDDPDRAIVEAGIDAIRA